MELPSFKLERYFARFETGAKFHLSASDSETCGLPELLALADRESLDLWDDLRFSYTDSLGHVALRTEIASLYEGVAANDIIVFSGAEEAIFTFMNVLARPSSHFVVVWPGYQSLYDVAIAAGAAVSLVRLHPASGWCLDLESIEASLQPNTAAIVVNFPHSPTGSMLSRGEFHDLVRIARAHGCYLFSDEVYRFGEYADEHRLPGAASLFERGVSLGVMSKSFGLPGLRIGWLACRDAVLIQKLRSFKDYLTICNSAPAEILALIALRARASILSRNRAITLSNLALLDAFFDRHAKSIRWHRPKAGSVGFPELVNGADADAFAAKLLDESGVLILPGSVFDYSSSFFRLGFGRQIMPDGLARLEAQLGC